MYTLSDRCARLRAVMTGQNEYERFYCAQYAVHSLLGQYDAAADGLSNTEILTAGMVRVIERFRPVLIPDELIVGFHFADSVFREYFRPDDTPEARAVMRDNGISEAEIERYFAVRRENRPLFRTIRPELTQAEQD